MREPKNRLKESKKRCRLVETAKNLFSKYGSKRVTVREICETSGVSKVTFYKYFDNKVDLIRHIRDEWIEEGFSAFDAINAMEIPFPEKIERMTQWRIRFFSKLSSEFIGELYSLDDVTARFRDGFLKNIRDARDRGEIRRDLSPEFIWLVSERLGGLIRDGSWRTLFNDFSEFQTQMRRLFFYGLLVRHHEEGEEEDR